MQMWSSFSASSQYGTSSEKRIKSTIVPVLIKEQRINCGCEIMRNRSVSAELEK
jgi:hypothetical protein